MPKFTEDVRRKALAAFIKAKMAEMGVSFPDLVRRLEQRGSEPIDRTVLFNKVSRGSFPATFLLELLDALDIDPLRRDEIEQYLPATGGDTRD